MLLTEVGWHWPAPMQFLQQLDLTRAHRIARGGHVVIVTEDVQHTVHDQ